MKRWLWLPLAVCACAWFLTPRYSGAAAPESIDEAAKELVFVPVKIDGPLHNPAQHTYWFGPFAECSSVLDDNYEGTMDVNNDGRPDVLSSGWKAWSSGTSQATTARMFW